MKCLQSFFRISAKPTHAVTSLSVHLLLLLLLPLACAAQQTVDNDRDGMPDDWELAHGLNPNDASDAELDSDGDQMIARQEYLAGTDPHDPKSRLAITTWQMSEANFTMGFPTQLGILYRVECKDSLDDSTWTTLSTQVATSLQTQLFLSVADRPSRFYRLSASRSADAPVAYSVNAVGYVTVRILPGTNLIKVPLSNPPNTVTSLLPSVPDGTQVYTGTPQVGTEFIEGFGWIGNVILSPWEGFQLVSVASFGWSWTFVGEVFPPLANSPELVDLLIRTDSDPFAGDNVYQATPAEVQSVTSIVPAGTPARFEVKVENEDDGTGPRSLTVQAAEGEGPDWRVAYWVGASNISAQITQPSGYSTALLPAGGSEIIVIEMTPGLGLLPGSGKETTLKAFFPNRGSDTVKARGVLACAAQQQTVVWKEDFESDSVWDRWLPEGGLWEVGTPTAGPKAAFGGLKCAATGLAGNYPSAADARLVRDTPFVVPTASDNPRLHFRQWFNLGKGDQGTVEVRVGQGTWQVVSQTNLWDGSGWSQGGADLRAYAGQRVQLAFRFKATDAVSGSPDEGLGWFVDDVALVTGPPVLANTFECGWGDWSGHGWEGGVPTGGPGKGRGGQNCAAVDLAGKYGVNADARLVSPPFLVPSADQYPRFRFFHWHSFNAGDQGTVEIRTGQGAWQVVSQTNVWDGSGWSQGSVDLREYAAQEVQLAFHFKAADAVSGGPDEGPGWYVDDVRLVMGQPRFNNPEGFESGWGDWYAEGAGWEVGIPTSGPGKARTGLKCAATVLKGNYGPTVDSRLITPAFIVPAADANPALRFWHWYNFGLGDQGAVEIRLGSAAWQKIAGPFENASAGWAGSRVDLTPYSGQMVQVAFHFTATDAASSGPDEGPGWYIDDLSIPAEVLPPIENIATNELELVAIPITASGSGLVFSLGEGAPEGAMIDPLFGLFTWVPSEIQGPSTNSITIYLTSPNSALNPIDSQTFNVTVNEVNAAPVVDSIGPKRARTGVPLTFPVTAYDSDWPTNALIFTLDPGAPSGASVDPKTGVFSWTPTEEATGVHVITVRVTDDGIPPTNSVTSFTVNVNGTNTPPIPAPPENQVIPELTTLVVTNTAADGDIPPDLLAFELVSGPTGMSLNGANGVLTWTPSEAQGPSTNVIVVKVTDNGEPPLNATSSFTVVVNELNSAPTLTVPSDQRIDELTTLVVTNTATDADIPANVLSFELLSGPTGASLNSANGVLTWTPSEEQGPSTNVIVVKVTDNGAPPLSATNSFTVVVNELNTAPTLTVPSDQRIDELATRVVTNTATDTDIPANVLTFELLSGPTGASLNSTNGVLTWTPSEEQGPSTNVIVVKVADNGEPPLGVTNSFTIIVNEVNSAPTLAVPSDQRIEELTTLVVTNATTDADIPANLLTFELVSGPAGVTLDATTGVLVWRPTAAQAPSTNTITVTVRDDGSPSLSVTDSFTVVVLKTVPLKISDIILESDGHLRLTWTAQPGRTYRVQYKNSLMDTEWNNSGGEVRAVDSSASATDEPVGISQRFYRILQID